MIAALAEIAAREALLQPSPDRLDPMSAGQEGTTGEIGVHRSALNIDAGCAASSMWMFDAYGLAGDELCIYYHGVGSRFSNLGEFGWSHAVRSLWAGDEAAEFWYLDWPRQAYPRVGAWQRIDHADFYIANAWAVFFHAHY